MGLGPLGPLGGPWTGAPWDPWAPGPLGRPLDGRRGPLGPLGPLGSLWTGAPWAPGPLGRPLDGRPVGPWAPWQSAVSSQQSSVSSYQSAVISHQSSVSSHQSSVISHRAGGRRAGGRAAGGRANSDPTGVHPPTQDCYPPAAGDEHFEELRKYSEPQRTQVNRLLSLAMTLADYDSRPSSVASGITHFWKQLGVLKALAANYVIGTIG